MANCEACWARNQLPKTLDAILTIAGKKLECIDSFTYLRSLLSLDRSAQKDIKNILSEARNAVATLRSIVIGLQHTNFTPSLQQHR